jgi:hypothetical protein
LRVPLHPGYEARRTSPGFRAFSVLIESEPKL